MRVVVRRAGVLSVVVGESAGVAAWRGESRDLSFLGVEAAAAASSVRALVAAMTCGCDWIERLDFASGAANDVQRWCTVAGLGTREAVHHPLPGQRVERRRRKGVRG